jgi:hypothetical protein
MIPTRCDVFVAARKRTLRTFVGFGVWRLGFRRSGSTKSAQVSNGGEWHPIQLVHLVDHGWGG